MAKKKLKTPPTLTELLKAKLAEVDSIRAVARSSEVDHAALLRFLRGDQSLRLDAADRLAAHFGIRHMEEGGE